MRVRETDNEKTRAMKKVAVISKKRKRKEKKGPVKIVSRKLVVSATFRR